MIGALPRHSTPVDRTMGVVRNIPILLPLLSDWCVISVCNLHNRAGHSTLLDKYFVNV